MSMMRHVRFSGSCCRGHRDPKRNDKVGYRAREKRQWKKEI